MRRSPDGYRGTLGDMITSFAPELGSTPEGSAWVMKVLNPSAPIIPSGMPDRNTTTVVNYNFEGNFIIEAGTGVQVGDYINYQINLHMHPVVFADVIKTRSSAPTDIANSETLLNTQLPDATVYPALPGTQWGDRVVRTTANMQSKMAYWQNQCQHARCTYAGWTLTPTYSSDNNQGLVVCVQQAQTPRTTTVLDSKNGEFISQKYYGPEDFATFENSTNLPRAYTAQMVEGCYTVGKLNEVPETFIDQTSPVAISSHLVGATTGTLGSEPSPHMFIAIKNGTPGIPKMSDFMPQIFIKGAAPSTSFMLRYRYGFEVRPFTGAPNTPFAKDAPPYDELAMRMYSRLMLELQLDGYPADYNLFEWLGKAIRKAAPYVKKAVIGGMQGLASGGGLMGALQGAAGGAMQEYEQQQQNKRVRLMPPEDYNV